MKRTALWCVIALGLGLFGYTLASGGAGAGAQKLSLKVAEIAFPENRLLEIYETGSGGFSYVQSGPYGTIPVPLPDDLAEHGDPMIVFQTLAPGQAMPKALTRAVKRARAFMATSMPAAHDDPEAQGDPPDGASMGASMPAAHDGPEAQLSGRDTNQSGPTDQAGCPEWWFNQATVDQQLFCPNQGNAVCYKWVNWAFFYSTRAHNGYGAVCSDSGTAIFQTTYEYIVDTFWVEEGTWRFVQYAPYRVCGAWPFGWSCTVNRRFQKFELLNGPAKAHFGSRIY
jgi:hypothetical protein